MESIVDPSAEIAAGYQDGVMPANFGELFTDPQLDGLVEYLLEATGGGRSSGRRRPRGPRGRARSRPRAAAAAEGPSPPDRPRLAPGALVRAARLGLRDAARHRARAAMGFEPLWELQVLIVAWTVIVPLAFLAGLGGFDYWLYWISGRPTRPEDHSGHGARTWKDYFRVNTDHKVIGIQYVVTTIFFFVAAGLMAMFMRAELAQPGMQYVDTNTFNGLFSVHASLMIFLFIIPAFAGLGNYVIPLMIGAPDMAFPRLNALSFWLLPIAGLIMISELPRARRRRLRGRLDELRAAGREPGRRQPHVPDGRPVGGRVVDHDRPQLPGHHHHDARPGCPSGACRCSCGRTSPPRRSSSSRRRSWPARSSSSCSTGSCTRTSSTPSWAATSSPTSTSSGSTRTRPSTS